MKKRLSKKELDKLVARGAIKGYFDDAPKKKERPADQGMLPFTEKENQRKPRRKHTPYEFYLHVNCVSRMKFYYPEEWEDCYHYPAEEDDDTKRHFNFKKDVKPGFWDYLVLIERHGFAGLFIEFKVTSGLSDEQKDFRRRHRHRFVFAVVKTEDRFMAVMEWYLGRSKVKDKFRIK